MSFLDDEIVALFELCITGKEFVDGFNELLDERNKSQRINHTDLKRINNCINLAMDRIEKEHGIRLMKKDDYYNQVMEENFG